VSEQRSLSPSGAALWAQCPRRWWYRYVDKLPEPPPGEPAILGTFVHSVLELLLDEPPAARTIDHARELARVAWAPIESSDEWIALELDEAAALRFRKRAWATIEAYFACEQPQDVQPVAQELEVRVEIEGVPFRGFIDLVERDPVGDIANAVIVTDYKTGKPPVPGKSWSEAQQIERLWQPQWYAAALREMGEHEPVRARLLFFNAADGRNGGGFQTRTAELAVEVTDESMDQARGELVKRWDDIGTAIAAGEAESRPGPLCGWCPFVDICAEGRAECERRWAERNDRTGGRRLREDAPAVATLGLV
jgi:putative RecB family exonuclease